MTDITPTLTVEVDVNEFLASGADRIDASLTVTPAGFENVVAAAVKRAAVLVIDVSGSMNEPADNRGTSRITVAVDAAGKLIDSIPDGTYFSIVTFSDGGSPLVPLTVASESTRAQAKRAVASLGTGGGTHMSRGLSAARTELNKQADAESTVIFLTDGANNADDASLLASELRNYQELRRNGRAIPVQARGVGTDWQVDQLRQIAEATQGEPPRLVDGATIAADFAETFAAAQRTAVSDVRVVVWTPQSVKIKDVKQTVPSIQSLTGSEKVDGQNHVYATGAWDKEPREFYVAFALTAQPDGKKVCAGKVSIAYKLNGQEVVTPPTMVMATWTDNAGLSSRIPMGVARATGQVELATAIQEGVKALNDGDNATATAKLGRAAQIAEEQGNHEATARLKKIVDIEDASTGTVKVKKNVDKGAAMDLDAQSTRTAKSRPSGN